MLQLTVGGVGGGHNYHKKPKKKKTLINNIMKTFQLFSRLVEINMF